MSAKPRFTWRAGFRSNGLKPDTAARELERIKKAGPLTPPRIVEAATPEDAPLHPPFEWDDGAAAGLYRL